MKGRLEQLKKDVNLLSAMQGLILPPNEDPKTLQRELGAFLNQQRMNSDSNAKNVNSKDKILTRKNCVAPNPHQSDQWRDYVDRNSKNEKTKTNRTVEQLQLTNGAICRCVSHRSDCGARAKRRRGVNGNSHPMTVAPPEFLDAVHEEASGGDGHLQFPLQRLDREKLDSLKCELHFERGKRLELQEASMRVAVRLQKTEDELRRETKIKSALLVEKLELKNHIQDYIERVQRLEFEVKSCKTEHASCGDKMQTLNNEKLRLEEELLQLTVDVEKRAVAAKHENSELTKNLAQVQSKLEALQSQQNVTLTEKQTAKQESQKLQFQVDQLLQQCVRLETEKERLLKDVAQSSAKAKETETQFRQVNEQLSRLQRQFQEQQMHHGAILQKSQSNLVQQRRIVATQIEQCYSLLAKTKPLISQLQLEKEALEKSLAQETAENICLVKQLKLANAKVGSLQEHEKRRQEQLGNIVSKHMDRITRLQTENSDLKCQVNQDREDRHKMLEVISAAKHKLASERLKFAEGQDKDELEKERLRSEAARVQDNFHVLQKINHDNTTTISKLRTEAEAEKRQKSELEQKLSEKTAAEHKLSLKLREKESQCVELEDRLEYLQQQVRAMRGEMEEHDCEYHVESVHKSRLAKVETQKSELESRLETFRAERDQAIAAGRRCVQIAQHTKLECDNQILQVWTSTKQQVAELEEKRQADMVYYKKKIADLELQLKHAWTNTHETQQRLSNKIQHLQAVLATTAQALCHSGGGGEEASLSTTAFGTLNTAKSEDIASAGIDASINRKFNEYFSRPAAKHTTNPFL